MPPRLGALAPLPWLTLFLAAFAPASVDVAIAASVVAASDASRPSEGEGGELRKILHNMHDQLQRTRQELDRSQSESAQQRMLAARTQEVHQKELREAQHDLAHSQQDLTIAGSRLEACHTGGRGEGGLKDAVDIRRMMAPEGPRGAPQRPRQSTASFQALHAACKSWLNMSGQLSGAGRALEDRAKKAKKKEEDEPGKAAESAKPEAAAAGKRVQAADHANHTGTAESAKPETAAAVEKVQAGTKPLLDDGPKQPGVGSGAPSSCAENTYGFVAADSDTFVAQKWSRSEHSLPSLLGPCEITQHTPGDFMI
jgi:hypothetical protein